MSTPRSLFKGSGRSSLGRILWVACIALLALAPVAASAPAAWIEAQKLTASDGSVDGNFGLSVSVSGEWAVVGADYDSDVGTWAGATYMLQRDATGLWVEAQKLTSSDGSLSRLFGCSVAIDRDRVIVGSIEPQEAAFVFEMDTMGTWSETQKLTPSDGGGAFGASVSISGDWAIVGAVNHDDRSGAAYVFERTASGTWIEVQKLTASDGAAQAAFGHSVALQDDTAVVGARSEGDLGNGPGAAYVFERYGGSIWVEAQKLTAADGSARDHFGHAVALDRDWAIISASDDGDLGDNSGSAYLFERNVSGVWVETQKLLASDGVAQGNFGSSVSIDGDRTIVGASGASDGRGSSYAFRRNATGAWVEAQKLSASDGAENDWFGYSVSIDDSWAIVGSYGDDDLGSKSGSAYLFALEDDCIARLRLASRAVRPGDDLVVALELEHNRNRTVRVPFRVWVEDADGMVIAVKFSSPQTFRFGDKRSGEVVLRIPEDTAPGTYTVFAGINKMRQGVASAARRFRVLQ